jgi:hypothetical protein
VNAPVSVVAIQPTISEVGSKHENKSKSALEFIFIGGYAVFIGIDGFKIIQARKSISLVPGL